MANGYLYLICKDCEHHPRGSVRANSYITFFRDYENYNGHGRWTKSYLEKWLALHIEGTCAGATHASRYEFIVDASRLRLSETLPDWNEP